MSYLVTAVGWLAVGVLVLVFADLIGVIQSFIFRHKSVSAEWFQRGIKLKLAFLVLFIMWYLYLIKSL